MPRTATTHPLHETLAQLGSAHEEFRKRLLYAPDEHGGWLWVTALTAGRTTHLQNLFARVQEHFNTTDKRAPAALWFGQYAFAVGAVAVACYLVARRVPDMEPRNVWARFEADGDIGAFAWQSPRFVGLPDDPAAAHWDCRIVDSGQALRAELRAQITGHLTPMIDAIKQRTPLGAPAMWALAADYCATAFTWVGGILGDEANGAAEARLFGAAPFPLALKRDFILVEQSGLQYHLLDRTACCLYYKCGSGDYCSGCPLRPRAERIRLIRQWLEKRAAGGGAE